MVGVPEQNDFTAVGAYVSEVVGCSPDRVTAVSRFPDGNRHAVYKVSYLGAGDTARDVVARISFDGAPADCAQAEREASVLERVGGLAAPLLHDFRCMSPWFDTPIMCMEFLPGSQQALGSATPEELERLGSVVAALHGRAANGLAESWGAMGDIASYAESRLESILSGLAWVRAPLPALIRDRLEGAADALETCWEGWRDAESFRTDETLALLHGDIGPGNIVWSPDPVLIDWEYTRLGDPADEIAYLLDQNGLTPPRRQAFWRGYRESSGSQVRVAHVARRVDWWERLTLLGSTLWWVERWVRRAAGEADPAVPREQDYYFGHIVSRLDRLDDLLA
jgi:aminoglycoside phosphotransferase (APT) family kinase protein